MKCPLLRRVPKGFWDLALPTSLATSTSALHLNYLPQACMLTYSAWNFPWICFSLLSLCTFAHTVPWAWNIPPQPLTSTWWKLLLMHTSTFKALSHTNPCNYVKWFKDNISEQFQPAVVFNGITQSHRHCWFLHKSWSSFQSLLKDFDLAQLLTFSVLRGM